MEVSLSSQLWLNLQVSGSSVGRAITKGTGAPDAAHRCGGEWMFPCRLSRVCVVL